MRKWWFSIVCYITTILLAIYSFVGAWFLDDKTWWMITQMISELSSLLLLIIIGIANQPKKEEKELEQIIQRQKILEKYLEEKNKKKER